MVSNMAFLFHVIYGIIPTPLTSVIFFKMVETTNQIICVEIMGMSLNHLKTANQGSRRFEDVYCLNWWSWMFMKLFILQSRHSFGGLWFGRGVSLKPYLVGATFKLQNGFCMCRNMEQKRQTLIKAIFSFHIVDYWLKSYTLLPFSYTFCG